MKKIRLLQLIGLTILFTQGLPAQSGYPEKLPVDPKVRLGKLPNGMTYYIRHNELPKERADFYIVQNVGSMQEEDNQRGLAHFLEHMAFNGSKNFPKETRSIDDFTESIGMRMGANLNAYTNFDETVYMMSNVPVTKQEVIDSCLLILHDWSAFLTLSDSLIEKERGVIREEWRTSTSAQMRLWEQQLPKMYPGSRYAHRLPIGTIDVINNFKPEELRDYYRKWYRPDLQAVIIVGDIDVDRIEEKIKTMFKDIPAPVNPAPRELSPVPDNKEPLVSIATDKETPNTILYIYYKHNTLPEEVKGTIVDYLTSYMQQVVSHAMQERFSEILQKANPPFLAAFASDGEYMVAKTKDAWTSAALVKPGSFDEAMNAVVAETNRMKLFGLTAAEYDRAKTNLLMNMESIYKDRDNQRNNSFTEEYVRSFTTGECIPGIEMEYQLMQQLTSMIPLQNINDYVKSVIGDDNIVISLMGPEKEGITYPTADELLEKFLQAQAIPVEARQEEASGEPLITSLPAPGKILEVKENPLFGATVYKLSNGIEVIVKETEFKKDEILMRASSKGGSSLFTDRDVYNIKVLNQVIELGGLSDFSATTLTKMLTGKNVSCRTVIGDDYEAISGTSVPADIRTLFELIYLSFTAPRSDEEAFASFSERLKGQMENLKLNPMVAFSDSLTQALYDNQIRAKRIELEDLQHINYSRIMEMYRERYADASDFVFTFVGNIGKDSIIPMMEQYLATLPALRRIEQGDISRMPVFREGNYTNHFNRTLETPKASIITVYSGQMNYDIETVMTSAILKQILDLVYMEKVREKESGTYAVSTAIDISVFPLGRTILQTYFDTDPELKVKLSAIVKDELMAIANNGPREIDFSKTRENMLKRYDEAIQENSYWLAAIEAFHFRGIDRHTDYKTRLESITPEKIRDFAKKLIEQGNYIEVVMEP
ncbi:MAG: insulinase family protein [Tannerella sp.]|jgi:zinc protease|nr:insulinase family protein [Tannerella sp.]